MRDKLHNALKNRVISGIFLVMLGNISLLAAKLVIWLIVPKMLGISEYGYYKLFTLYLAYVMILHFGFPDGILLILGGKEYEEIDKAELRMYSRFLVIFLMIISVLGIVIGFLVAQGIYRYIFCMLGVDAFFVNLATYFKFLSQATMRFKELTIRNSMEALLQVLLIFIIIILSRLQLICANAQIYIFGLVLIDALILIWYMFRYREIILGQAIKICWKMIAKIFTTGILLTMAFQISHLVFVLDRQMVSMLFDIDTYALYAFAYSIVNMITAIINAISTVLFPSLKKTDEEKAIEQYPIFLSGITSFVFLLLAGYYPLSYFIQWFLPEYANSLRYIEVILPGLSISACINIVIFTYYKVFNQIKRYLYIALAVLLIGVTMNYGGYCLWNDPIVFAVASILTLLCWYIVVQRFIIKKFHIRWLGNLGYICLLILLFYIVTYLISNRWLAMVCYLTGYILITLTKYRKGLQI